MAELKKWYELPIGGVIDQPATALAYKTGTWRVMRPIWHEDKCTSCMMCWLHCPDNAIVVKDAKMKGMNYDYCKGCGVCARVCPVNAIDMEPETKFLEEAE
ncbi:MAG: pyruvate ferredoxin oxidoreductase delta subunit [Thermotogota bacterium]|nr:pyruvate ferredoxin oxidoreductase delta subunit [Thermotogota bacterium]MDK2864668.1 pyruvate ferredoxin oxidoreductase delta subunit [Thermotogota bacterium]HCZ06175.1 pyruvate synthase [Thermotogota bacterium]